MSFNVRLKVYHASMETLSTLEAFVRSAESGSFSAAARKLGVTPAAVSKSVAKLEESLGARLFQRTTRKLRLTDVGERLFEDASRGLSTLRDALERVASDRQAPSGTLKVSLAPAVGRIYVLPMLPTYLRDCPKVSVSWHFENRQVDLVGEGFDVGVGAGVGARRGHRRARARAHPHRRRRVQGVPEGARHADASVRARWTRRHLLPLAPHRTPTSVGAP